MKSNETLCRIGSEDHKKHDELIEDLEASIWSLEEYKRTAERTPRILAERVIRLEKAVKTLYTWLPKNRQLQIEKALGVKP